MGSESSADGLPDPLPKETLRSNYMRVGAFELTDPLPRLRDPHLFTILQPWIDVGSVGTLALATLEKEFGAEELGKLARPSNFYDFTRYRPMLNRRDGERIVEPPNTVIRYAKGEGESDFLFMHLLEPHANGEDFVDSLIELADTLGVARYCQIGAMYGSTPHTRPLVASGQSTDADVQGMLASQGVRTSNYEGPTSIMALATQELTKRNITTMSVLVQLPPYARLEEDHRGQERLLRLLSPIYRFSLGELDSIERHGDRQYQEIDRMAQMDPRVQSLVKQLEESYDSEQSDVKTDTGAPSEPEPPQLSADLERFLRDLESGEEGTSA